jgi:SnoaL-like polyketide cyclase
MDTLVKQQYELSLKNACVKFMFAYQQRNVEKMLSFCNPDGEIYFVSLGESGRGKIGELGKAIWTGLIDAFPDITNTLDAAIAEGKNIVRCQVVISGTQAKDFAGIENKGKHFDSDHIFIFHVDRENKIDHIQITWDHEDLQKQLS